MAWAVPRTSRASAAVDVTHAARAQVERICLSIAFPYLEIRPSLGIAYSQLRSLSSADAALFWTGTATDTGMGRETALSSVWLELQQGHEKKERF